MNYYGCNLVFSLWSYTLSFRSRRTLSCSLMLMVFAFVNPGEHPPVILIDTTAGQPYEFPVSSFPNAFFSARHDFSRSFVDMIIKVI